MFQIITTGKLHVLGDVQQKETPTFHESAVDRTGNSSHEKNKMKLLLKSKPNFVYRTFMVGIICCLTSITEGNLLAYYASPVFLN